MSDYNEDDTYMHHEGSWKRVNNIKDDGRSMDQGGGNFYHVEGVKDPIHQDKKGNLATGAMINGGRAKINKTDVDENTAGLDTIRLVSESQNVRNNTKPVKLPRVTVLANRKKLGKAELIKSLEEAGHRESALLLKNWDEMDTVAKSMHEKSKYDYDKDGKLNEHEKHHKELDKK